MSTLSVTPPFEVFTDIDGQPLEAGSIYIGVAGLNPITNPKNAYWDAALTQLATQPIATRGGYPLNGSSVGTIYVNGTYSMAVVNRIGSVVFDARTPTARNGIVVLNSAGAAYTV